MRSAFLLFFLVLAITTSCGIFPNSEWDTFKVKFGKSYPNMMMEGFRRIIFAGNMLKANMHNRRYEMKLESYKVEINQFSDFKSSECAQMFPSTVESQGVPFTAPNVSPQPSFSYDAQGFKSPVQDQGLVCPSSWAYASALAIQIYDASITGNLNSEPLSAQNFIDCAGEATACSKQVPQTAFNYLTQHFQKVYPQSEYRNNPMGSQGMCVLPVASTSGKTLKAFSTIADGNDSDLKYVVNYVAPVVIKMNPATFEFIHYKEGVFTQPRPTQNAAQYVVVEGYGTDKATGKDYWRIQNSFGSTWGESGFMRIEMNSAKPIAKSAIFPLE